MTPRARKTDGPASPQSAGGPLRRRGARSPADTSGSGRPTTSCHRLRRRSHSAAGDRVTPVENLYGNRHRGRVVAAQRLASSLGKHRAGVGSRARDASSAIASAAKPGAAVDAGQRMRGERNPALHDALEQQPAQMSLAGLHRLVARPDPRPLPGADVVGPPHRWRLRGARIPIAAGARRAGGPLPRPGHVTVGAGRGPARGCQLRGHERRRRFPAAGRQTAAGRGGGAQRGSAVAATRPAVRGVAAARRQHQQQRQRRRQEVAGQGRRPGRTARSDGKTGASGST